LALSGRLRSLAPITFDDTLDPAATRDRRLRFTTDSWDLKSHARSDIHGVSASNDKFRDWEVANGFPPAFVDTATGTSTKNTASDPFRSELRELLRSTPGTTQLNALELQRKLSVNHALDRDLNGRLRFRPFTPHPTSHR
jgi:hypothetical protein